MPEVFRTLLNSKKFLTSVIAMFALIAGRWGFHVDEEALYLAISPLLLYILAQGITDHGATAAKVQTTTTTTVASPTDVMGVPSPAVVTASEKKT